LQLPELLHNAPDKSIDRTHLTRDSAPLAQSKARILVVDDEPNIRDVVEQYLRREGYETLSASDGEEAIAKAVAARRIQAIRDVPIIMLTAKSEEMDKLVGLGVGADDYVTKPFSPRELVARIQAVLRRTQKRPLQPGDVVQVGSVRINPTLRRVERNGQPVELTAREFDLLLFLASNPGQVFTREQLLDHVWDFHFAGDTGTVTVHVRRLREKLELDPVRPQYVKTVWGVGYKVEAS
jgi:DNA-binding response OmpR family regulator